MMAQDPKVENIDSMGSMILRCFGGPASSCLGLVWLFGLGILWSLKRLRTMEPKTGHCIMEPKKRHYIRRSKAHQ